MTVDIAFSINQTLRLPVMTVINSVLQNTSVDAECDLIRFNLVVPMGDRVLFETAIADAFGERYDQSAVEFRVREFTPPDYLKTYLDERFQERQPQRRISRYMQYARLFLKSIFSDVTRVIYFDADVLVLGNVRSLFSFGEKLSAQCYLGAVPQNIPAIFYFTNPLKLLPDLKQFTRTFNSGVLLTDLGYWNDATYDLLKHYLTLDQQNHYKLFRLGDETVFNLMFKGAYLPLPKEWNYSGYGQPYWMVPFIKRDPKKISVIHWSGGYHKPWKGDNVIYSDLWREYIPEPVSV